MSNQPFNSSRRRAMKMALGGAMTIPLANLLLSGEAFAAQRVDPSSKLAKQLMYHEDASKAPRKAKTGVPAKKQACNNCRYFMGNASTKYGPCQIFMGKKVNANGWCNQWTKS